MQRFYNPQKDRIYRKGRDGRSAKNGLNLRSNLSSSICGCKQIEQGFKRTYGDCRRTTPRKCGVAMKFTHCKINFLGGKILKFRRNFTASFALLRFCATPQTLFGLCYLMIMHRKARMRRNSLHKFKKDSPSTRPMT